MITKTINKNTIFEQTTFILKNTNDGNQLAGRDLKLIENGVNGFLNEQGEIALTELYEKVKSGKYTLPWFCEIENLTRGTNGDRSVFWKGIKVEHYDHDFWCSEGWQERIFKDATELARRCKIIESSGLEVNFDNVCWNWNKIAKTLGVFEELEPIAI